MKADPANRRSLAPSSPGRQMVARRESALSCRCRRVPWLVPQQRPRPSRACSTGSAQRERSLHGSAAERCSAANHPHQRPPSTGPGRARRGTREAAQRRRAPGLGGACQVTPTLQIYSIFTMVFSTCFSVGGDADTGLDADADKACALGLTLLYGSYRLDLRPRVQPQTLRVRSPDNATIFEPPTTSRYFDV
jgi:hypothetical protein